MTDKGQDGTVSSVDFAERWMQDGLRAVDSAGGFLSISVHMDAAASLINTLRLEGIAMTYAPPIVCATAKALSRHPKLHRLVAGTKQLRGGAVDVCVSIAGDAIVTPVVIIENAGQKDVIEIADELRTKTPIVRARDEQMMRFLRRWGWLVPFGFLRQLLLRFLLRKLWYRRKVSGTFQVTILPSLDLVVPLTFNTAAALGVGGIAERPVVINGHVITRLTAPLTCSIDHKQWNGTDALTFLKEVKTILESEASSLRRTNAISAAAGQ